MKILLLFVLQSFIQSHESTNQIMCYVVIVCWMLSNRVTICLSSASPLQITWTKLKSLWSSWGSETANSQWGNKSIFHNLQKIFFSSKQENKQFQCIQVQRLPSGSLKIGTTNCIIPILNSRLVSYICSIVFSVLSKGILPCFYLEKS